MKTKSKDVKQLIDKFLMKIPSCKICREILQVIEDRYSTKNVEIQEGFGEEEPLIILKIHSNNTRLCISDSQISLLIGGLKNHTTHYNIPKKKRNKKSKDSRNTKKVNLPKYAIGKKRLNEGKEYETNLGWWINKYLQNQSIYILEQVEEILTKRVNCKIGSIKFTYETRPPSHTGISANLKIKDSKYLYMYCVSAVDTMLSRVKSLLNKKRKANDFFSNILQ